MKANLTFHHCENDNILNLIRYCITPNLINKRKALISWDESEEEKESTIFIDYCGTELKESDSNHEIEEDIQDQLIDTVEDFPHKGSYIKHIEINVKPSLNKSKVNKAIKKLKECANSLITNYTPGNVYVIIIHIQNGIPHLHLLLENFDEEHGSRRLTWTPSQVRYLRTLGWTNVFNLNIHEKNENEFVDLHVTKQALIEKRISMEQAKNAVNQYMKSYVINNNIETKEELFKFFEKQGKYDLNIYTKAGLERKQPIIKIKEIIILLIPFCDRYLNETRK